jgi:hypothetical protein
MRVYMVVRVVVMPRGDRSAAAGSTAIQLSSVPYEACMRSTTTTSNHRFLMVMEAVMRACATLHLPVVLDDHSFIVGPEPGHQGDGGRLLGVMEAEEGAGAASQGRKE